MPKVWWQTYRRWRSTTWLAWKPSLTSSWMVKLGLFKELSCRSFLKSYVDQTKSLGGTSDLFLTLDILTYCPLSRDFLTACFPGYQYLLLQSPWDQWKHFYCVLRAKPPGRGLALLVSTFVFWASCFVVRQCCWAVKTWIWELDRPEFVLARKAWPHGWPSCSLVSGDSLWGSADRDVCHVSVLWICAWQWQLLFSRC